jgi:hypothetical protein
MQHRRLEAQAQPEAPQQLGRQSDLRHQHQRLAAVSQHPFQQLQVHLGFAAAGHAVQQVTAKTAQVVADCVHHPSLVRCQLRSTPGPQPVRRRGFARYPTLLEKPGQCLAPPAANVRQALLRCRTGGQGLQHGVLNRCPPRALLQAFAAGAGQSVPQRRRRQFRTSPAQRRRERADHDLSGRVLVVLPAPLQQSQQVRVQQGHIRIQHLADGQQAVGGQVAPFGVRDHQPDQPAAPEGHQHACADGRDGTVCGSQVIEQPGHRHRQRDLDNGPATHETRFYQP